MLALHSSGLNSSYSWCLPLLSAAGFPCEMRLLKQGPFHNAKVSVCVRADQDVLHEKLIYIQIYFQLAA